MCIFLEQSCYFGRVLYDLRLIGCPVRCSCTGLPGLGDAVQVGHPPVEGAPRAQRPPAQAQDTHVDAQGRYVWNKEIELNKQTTSEMVSHACSLLCSPTHAWPYDSPLDSLSFAWHGFTSSIAGGYYLYVRQTWRAWSTAPRGRSTCRPCSPCAACPASTRAPAGR